MYFSCDKPAADGAVQHKLYTGTVQGEQRGGKFDVLFTVGVFFWMGAKTILVISTWW
jgi:hypothetical protein